MIDQSLGKLGDEAERFEMMVIPVDIALQLSRIEFVSAVMIVGGPFGTDAAVLGDIILQLIPVHKDIFFLGRDGAFIQMHDKGKFDAVDGAENRRVRMNVKIPRLPLV